VWKLDIWLGAGRWLLASLLSAYQTLSINIVTVLDFQFLLCECPCVATGTYNNIIIYIQNVSYIVIRKCFIIHLLF
jgi:hypothetical protein